MAIMIPDVCYENRDNAEYILFNQFRDNLSDEFIVFYNTRTLSSNKKGKLRNGETDFIVLHEELGLLVLEAKSGKIKYSKGVWYRKGDGKEIKNPYKQARDNSYTIRNEIRAKSKTRSIHDKIKHIPFAVALPHCNAIDGTPTSEAKPEITLFKPDIKPTNIEKNIREIFNKYDYDFLKEGFSTKETELIKDVLGYSEFSYYETLGSEIETEGKQFIRLEDAQKKILETVCNKQILVKGVSGSGKTIIAREQARLWYKEDKRVLLLVFNVPIAEILQRQLKKLDRVDVFHFHGLCETVVNQTGGEWKVPENPNKQDNFYTNEAPILMEAALPEFKHLYGTYDAIVIDEAQDFDLYWWDIIRELFTNPDDPYLCIFYDPEQNIRKRELDFDQIENIVLPGKWAHHSLGKNWRNTRAIANYMHKACKIKGVTLNENVPLGEVPVEEWVWNVREERKWIRKKLDRLIRVEKIEKKDIVILSRYRFEKYIFAQNSTLGNFTVVDCETSNIANSICYATLDKFKGLERPCVILVGFNRQPLSRAERQRFYVGISRASNRLFVLFHRRRRIQITGLDESITPETLQEVFNDFGQIYYMGELKPSKKIAGTQVAHISFESAQSARKAVKQMNGYEFYGRTIAVELKG